MKRIAILALGAIAMMAGDVQTASAQQPFPFGFGFQPFGFYQPFGARFRSRTPTPPYFALSPPVYYSTQYARPYGISPFAAPPLVTAPPEFRGRRRSDFDEGVIRESPAVQRGGSCTDCNPFIHVSRTDAADQAQASSGPVRRNPFFETEDQLASR